MPIDPWIPVGFVFADGVKAKKAILAGDDWQIYEANPGGRILVAEASLGKAWIEGGLLSEDMLKSFNIGNDHYFSLYGGKDHVLSPVRKCQSPLNKNEAVAFAEAFRLTREIDKASSLHESIYVEKYSRILPTYSISDSVSDDVVFGAWLSGGVPVSVHSARRLRSLTSWLSESQLHDVLRRAGLESAAQVSDTKDKQAKKKPSKFTLPGRSYLENFFNEHVIDIVENQERYKKLGIDFPSAIILHGPPGCGKTFAVDRLVEYLDWPCYQVEASTIASPYIHETSKKIAAVFDKAMENSPAVIVIDEMDAFLADRKASGHQHSIEEISEFLRRIPEAIKNNVLIVGMTNRIDMIDQAILRRGRFDHVIKVDMASEQEIFDLLTKLIGDLPSENDINIRSIAEELNGRPLSDVAFVVREGGRLAARAGKTKLDQSSLMSALQAAPPRDEDANAKRIGFVV